MSVRPILFDAISGNLLHTFDEPTVAGQGDFGWSVAIDGNNVLIGAPADGEAHLFDVISGNLLQTFDDPTPTPTAGAPPRGSSGGDEFGFSVAIDGNNVLIGAPGDDTNGLDVGQAYLFSIPEPSTLVLAALGGTALILRRRAG